MTATSTAPAVSPEDRPELLPLLPLIAAVWSDGALAPAEAAALRRAVLGSSLLDRESVAALAPWIDPRRGPGAETLVRLERRILKAELDDEEAATRSLVDLGLALWRLSDAAGPWETPEAVEALREAEAATGLLGSEAARQLRRLRGEDLTTTVGESQLDSDALSSWLDRNHVEIRGRVLTLLQRPELMIPEGTPYAEHRERALEAVQLLADEGIGSIAYPSDFGGAADPAGSIAAFEALAYGDLSVLIKYGVQFGLFGGSVLQLGTQKHHERYLGDISTMALPGCYAMTETGHGSNVRALETTTTYHHESRTLVVHTPSEEAGKDWIGNAALHGRMATVFTRLIVDDEDHGVHAVLVPIRNDAGEPMPGIRIEDRGLKLGLNGVDNGRIWFDQVRVPVENLLDRFASITDDGRYESPIPSSGRRFFTMLGTLVAGRVSIAAASVAASRKGLLIAVRYASRRRQFGIDGAPETPILQYRTVQGTLLPALARTFAGHFAVREVQERYGAAQASQTGDPEVEVLAAALKAWTSDECVRTLQSCREMCGGQGYLAANGFAALKADTDIFTTFEGANLVLYQLAAKGLLSSYRDRMGSLNLRGALRYLGERAETSLKELNPVVKRRTDDGHLRDPEMHLDALRYRETRLLRSVAMRIRARLRDGMDSFLAINEVQDHLVLLAESYAERVALESFQRAVDAAPDAFREPLGKVCALFALDRIEADRGWFLESGYFEPAKSRAIRNTVNDLCAELTLDAVPLVDAFGVPEALVPELVRR